MRLGIILSLVIGSIVVSHNEALKEESVIHAKLRTTKNNQHTSDFKNEFGIDSDLDAEINEALNMEEANDDNKENSNVEEKENDNEENSDSNNDDEENTDVAEDEETDNEDAVSEDNNVEEQVVVEDPCKDVVCGKGEECVSIGVQTSCRCRSSCPPAIIADDKLCGSDNQTYASLCELHRTKCLYLRDKVKGAKRLRLRYYGPCKALPKCHRQEYSDFPLRMRSWIKNVYLQLYDEGKDAGGLPDNLRSPGRRLAANRQRLFEFEQGSYEAMERDMVQYQTLYRLPIYWKFVSLDKEPSDGFLSRSELEPLVATLIPLEPCTRAFFKRADLDKDRRISMEEWASALHMSEDDMDASKIL